MPLLELSRVGSLMYREDFRTGRTLFSKRALMAEEIDALIRQKNHRKGCSNCLGNPRFSGGAVL
jgi:hypothetical protein